MRDGERTRDTDRGSSLRARSPQMSDARCAAWQADRGGVKPAGLDVVQYGGHDLYSGRQNVYGRGGWPEPLLSTHGTATASVQRAVWLVRRHEEVVRRLEVAGRERILDEVDHLSVAEVARPHPGLDALSKAATAWRARAFTPPPGAFSASSSVGFAIVPRPTLRSVTSTPNIVSNESGPAVNPTQESKVLVLLPEAGARNPHTLGVHDDAWAVAECGDVVREPLRVVVHGDDVHERAGIGRPRPSGCDDRAAGADREDGNAGALDDDRRVRRIEQIARQRVVDRASTRSGASVRAGVGHHDRAQIDRADQDRDRARSSW